MSGRDAALFRRYLLGDLDEQENKAVERQYFEDEARLDSVSAAEETLIDDYLAGRLSADDRAGFERVYLASPHHRRRVAVVRALGAAAAMRTPVAAPRWVSRATWYAGLAAAAALLLAAGLWLAGDRTEPVRQVGEHAPPPPAPAPSPSVRPAAASPPTAAPPPAPMPRVFGVALSPMAVRAGGADGSVVIPAGTDVVALDLRATGNSPSGGRLRASVRRVAGDQIWQGAASPRTGVAARIQVPAFLLPPDDYIVTLSMAEAVGVRAIDEYFLRVRD